ncbi:hypothetical protein DHEL01_v212876 [Diaporthe helianthi]|uniref:Uncharacterized protein n=1 Tax=Diaporthe helianthi TaxID=158607 RepID=A0A2P5HEQ9_DIAHE|nr:hypothetical protein DHEL01_v212876 [Diaporthe helianthi]
MVAQIFQIFAVYQLCHEIEFDPRQQETAVESESVRPGEAEEDEATVQPAAQAQVLHPQHPHMHTVDPLQRSDQESLIDGAVWPIDHVLSSTLDVPPPPDNLDEIRSSICGTSRASLEPQTFTFEDWKRFRNAHNLATSEEARSRLLDGIIEGTTLGLDTANVKQGPVILTNLLPLLPNLVPGNPDRAYGARPETLHNSVRDALRKVILPTTALDLLCPNFVLHVKGPKGSSETASLQAVYDGALAARGIDALWRWGAEGDADEEGHTARTITCTYTADGVLRMFAVHSCPQPSTSLLHEEDTSYGTQNVGYITTRIGGWFMSESLDHFREGAAAFRNGLAARGLVIKVQPIP